MMRQWVFPRKIILQVNSSDRLRGMCEQPAKYYVNFELGGLAAKLSQCG
jgi:hypothetical protein